MMMVVVRVAMVMNYLHLSFVVVAVVVGLGVVDDAAIVAVSNH